MGMDSHGVKGCLQEETQLEAAIKGRNLPGGGIGRTPRVMHAREAYDPEWGDASSHNTWKSMCRTVLSP